jgi:hypothetical protein
VKTSSNRSSTPGPPSRYRQLTVPVAGATANDVCSNRSNAPGSNGVKPLLLSRINNDGHNLRRLACRVPRADNEPTLDAWVVPERTRQRGAAPQRSRPRRPGRSPLPAVASLGPESLAVAGSSRQHEAAPCAARRESPCHGVSRVSRRQPGSRRGVSRRLRPVSAGSRAASAGTSDAAWAGTSGPASAGGLGHRFSHEGGAGLRCRCGCGPQSALHASNGAERPERHGRQHSNGRVQVTAVVSPSRSEARQPVPHHARAPRPAFSTAESRPSLRSASWLRSALKRMGSTLERGLKPGSRGSWVW